MEEVEEINTEEVAWGQCILPLSALASPQPLHWLLTCFVN